MSAMAAFAVAGLALAGCSSDTDGADGSASQSEDAAQSFSIAYSTIDPGVPYFAGLVQGIEEGAERLGVTITTVTDASFDAVKQGNDMADLIAQSPDGIMVTPISATQSLRWAEDAAEAGIPVLATMSPVGESYDGPLPEGVVGSIQVRPQDAGAKAADILSEFVSGDGAVVGVLMGPDGTATTPGFYEGFADQMATYGDFEIVQSSYNPESTTSAGLQSCQALIESNPDIEVIFSESDEMSVGCVQAPNIGDVRVAGVGATNAVLQLIEEGQGEGTMVGSTCWMPVDFGNAAIELFHGILSGEIEEGTIQYFDVPGITYENLSECPLEANAN